jgi:hypothetical protein
MWHRVDCILQTPAHAGSSLADFSTLKIEAIRFSEKSVYTRSTRRHIPKDGILPGPPSLGFDARLVTLLCKNIIVEKPKEVKTRSNLAESSKEGYGSEKGCTTNDNKR